MSRFDHALVHAADGAAGAVGVAGCGSDAVPDGSAPAQAAAPPREPAAASPSAYATSAPDGDAGWAAPAALDGASGRQRSEEFRSGAALRRWGYFEGDFGRNRMNVQDGRLVLVPAASTWADTARACFLYRGVRGDFDVRARVHVTGRSHAGRSLAGLLVRAEPAGEGTERWLAVRTGVVDGRRVVQRQETAHSRSEDTTMAGAAGWTDLRVVRRGSRFALFSRAASGGGWRPRGYYVRTDLPQTLEVGVDAFGGHGDPSADVRVQVDWVRFSRD
jgi:hypothetical protein